MDPQPNQKIVKESNISFKTQNDIDVKKVSLINTVKQVEESYAIAFNNSGSIVVTGCDETIKVWRFEQGRMIEKQKLVGHTDIIYCLVFSQKHNWFASSSKDYTLRCWREDENKDWISSQPGKSHSNNIYCLILTNEEDQIISCSGDQTIKVWKVNYIINQNTTIPQIISTLILYTVFPQMNQRQDWYLVEEIRKQYSGQRRIANGNSSMNYQWMILDIVFVSQMRNKQFGNNVMREFLIYQSVVREDQQRNLNYILITNLAMIVYFQQSEIRENNQLYKSIIVLFMYYNRKQMVNYQ